MKSNTQDYAACLIILCTIVIVGCSVSGKNQSTSIASQVDEVRLPRQIGEKEDSQRGQEKLDILVEKAENIIYRDETGNIAGQIRIAVLRMNESSTAGSLKQINHWEKSLARRGFADIRIDLETQLPYAITTTAPLLFIFSYPTGLSGQKFIQQLERYVQRGGLVFFGSGLPRQLVAKASVRRVSHSHPILTFPYTIKGLSRMDLPREVEIEGKTAAFAFGLGKKPTYLKLGVNLIAYAIAHHPHGRVYLEKSLSESN